jgi:hypothetical protein
MPYIFTHIYIYIYIYIYIRNDPPQNISLKFHYFLFFPQKELPTYEILPPKIKQKILLINEGEGNLSIQPQNITKLSFLIFAKVKCITLHTHTHTHI